MIIPINDDYQIAKIDDMNWCIQQRRVAESGKSAGEARWVSTHYYMTVAQCCKRLALTIADSADATTLHDYAAELHKITREMVRRVEEAVK